MADNMQIVCKIGETKVYFSVVLKDTKPDTGILSPTDLTGWSGIKMTVKRTDGTVIIDDLECNADGNQTLNTGKIVSNPVDLTTGEFAELVTGRHMVEFAAVNESGGVRFFPMSDDDVKTYGEFIVQESL